MYDVVKLILVCQIKDDIIPQLIPLIWINSVIVVLLILLILIINYYYHNSDINYCCNNTNRVKILLKW